ncbi:transcriptional regulator [Micromonospora craterilacus]|uniref:Transcriptional regulator n=1 Tax=Micromonospora craterilacus TaxID=1655439 RepID=A0A2W2EG81_9ACTN|nr:transcriptional regulator [Micromonospora craterilacus]PZG21433.1 transcriptional regulator [Micromonospora craterilacus]
MSRQEVAEAVNAYLWHTYRTRTSLDANHVGKLERGEHRWPKTTTREAFRAVLKVARDVDLGFYITRGQRHTDDVPHLMSPGQALAATHDQAGESPTYGEITHTGDMNRRELLRLLSLTGALLAAPAHGGQLDWARIASPKDGTKRLDPATLDVYEGLNAHLWAAFGAAESKMTVSPLVNRQFATLAANLRRSHTAQMHRRLCRIIADLLQLAGEVAFDTNAYSEAAHCYTLAAAAAREAAAYDLWACAMVRHAFISVYERDFRHAAPMLEAAADLARNGDSALSTRHWAHTVRAQALAGLGDLRGCQQALDRAEDVNQLSGRVHNGGWLRFDGSRLAEERGACYVELGRPDLAEPVLSGALSQKLSVRRRGTVLADLAMVGVQRSDVYQIVLYGSAVLDTARQSDSGVVGAKLHRLQQHLYPFLADRHVQHLNSQIAALTRAAD